MSLPLLINNNNKPLDLAADNNSNKDINALVWDWISNEDILARFNADIARELNVTTQFVSLSHIYHGEFIDPEPFATLDDYIAAVRAARIASVHARQAELAAHEADYQKRRRAELKLQRATNPPATPTRTQPPRLRASSSSAVCSTSGGIQKKTKTKTH